MIHNFRFNHPEPHGTAVQASLQKPLSDSPPERVKFPVVKNHLALQCFSKNDVFHISYCRNVPVMRPQYHGIFFVAVKNPAALVYFFVVAVKVACVHRYAEPVLFVFLSTFHPHVPVDVYIARLFSFLAIFV